jgi:hypothetical protein
MSFAQFFHDLSLFGETLRFSTVKLPRAGQKGLE